MDAGKAALLVDLAYVHGEWTEEPGFRLYLNDGGGSFWMRSDSNPEERSALLQAIGAAGWPYAYATRSLTDWVRTYYGQKGKILTQEERRSIAAMIESTERRIMSSGLHYLHRSAVRAATSE